MTDLEKYAQFVLKWEGGLGRSLEDSASKLFCPTPYKGVLWHTSHGITYTTWKNMYGASKDEQFFSMPTDMWWKIFKSRFYDKIQGDKIEDKKIAFFVTEIAWMSGVGEGVEHLQKALNDIGSKVVIDGDLGPKTIDATNKADADKLFKALYVVRSKFYEAISKGKNKKFYKGWMNRLNEFYKLYE